MWQATTLLARLARAGEDAIISQIKAAKSSEGRPRRIKRSWALVFATVAWLTVAVLAWLSRRRL